MQEEVRSSGKKEGRDGDVERKRWCAKCSEEYEMELKYLKV
jgi:hypothetical protein